MKLVSKEDMEFNISIGEHPHRTYSRLYWTRILMKQGTIKMPDVSEEYFKELREHLATNSQKLKWQRIADNERHSNGIYKVTAIRTKLMDRYLNEKCDGQ